MRGTSRVQVCPAYGSYFGVAVKRGAKHKRTRGPPVCVRVSALAYVLCHVQTHFYGFILFILFG